MEKRTGRLNLLVDPRKKKIFDDICDLEDTTPSQKIRQFMRDCIAQHMGPNWAETVLSDDDPVSSS